MALLHRGCDGQRMRWAEDDRHLPVPGSGAAGTPMRAFALNMDLPLDLSDNNRQACADFNTGNDGDVGEDVRAPCSMDTADSGVQAPIFNTSVPRDTAWGGECTPTKF
ncbi:hypothetical protein NDU88_001466 [Pleurodeles waltl]|uniref:Uncharacterized protein n=1 Tax=Pleurodeles waltl TaxID=8319 RepID=A0AAV7S8P6_PLEWA|nr:hypothetical protein NDU88_001466 [Pleurodeles waltl]